MISLSLRPTARTDFLCLFVRTNRYARSASLTNNGYIISPSRFQGVYVQGQQEMICNSLTEAMNYLIAGSRNRVVAKTDMNAVSSRSHAVYTVSLEQMVKDGDGEDAFHLITSKLTFVDLAGSERLKRTNAVGQQAKEGIQINAGLFVLGQVINCLADDQKLKAGKGAAHIPYRDSKLTYMLKDALGGNSQTLFIACLSCAEDNAAETKTTLEVCMWPSE